MTTEPNFPEDAHEGSIVNPAVTDDPFAGYDDYFFSTAERKDYYLPDGKQFLTIKVMNERDREKFEHSTRSSTIVNSKTQDMKIDVDPSAQRHAIITSGVVGWHLVRRDPNGRAALQEFSESNLRKWLSEANPVIVDAVAEAITKLNPWIRGDRSVEDMEREIEDLQERIEEKKREEARKNS